MEKQIKRITTQLKLQYFIFWLIPVLLVIAYETDLLSVGIYADDPRMQYIWETIGVLTAIVFVPLSLKLFSIVLKRKIDEYAFPVALKQYILWSAIRLGILEVAEIMNIVVYYLTLNNVGGFCSLIALTASLFCLPGDKRLREELKIAADEKEN